MTQLQRRTGTPGYLLGDYSRAGSLRALRRRRIQTSSRGLPGTRRLGPDERHRIRVDPRPPTEYLRPRVVDVSVSSTSANPSAFARYISGVAPRTHIHSASKSASTRSPSTHVTSRSSARRANSHTDVPARSAARLSVTSPAVSDSSARSRRHASSPSERSLRTAVLRSSFSPSRYA